MTDPTASAWEVTRLILASPSTSPSEIAEAHGFNPSEIAELLPFVLDGLPVPLAPPAAANLTPEGTRRLAPRD